jgi:type VI secretion system protein ImpM
MADAATGAALGPVGAFGKLPARGDFIRRGLPQPFVDAWDGWLAAGIAASRAALGDAWLPAFLEAPAWCFALAPGIAGPGIAGIMVPSVDRAGRYFPLTLAAPAGHAPRLLAAPGWFAQLAGVAVAALDEAATLEGFEAALAGLPPPPATPDPAPFAGGLAAPEPALLVAAATPVLFWTAGGARVAPRVAALPALPPAEAFAQLLADAPAAPPPFNAALFGDA